jgi:glycosyltransferase involved in cell wall biosynthesis
LTLAPMTLPTSPARRLRVLQCITRLGLGGAERVAFAIMRELRDQIDFGVFTVHGASDDAIGADMRRTLETTPTPWFAGTSVPMKAGGMVPGGFALRRAVRRFQPDVVHLHSETPEACAAVMMRLLPGEAAPHLARTIHNSVFWRYWPRVGRWCDRQLAGATIACVSEAARAEFIRYRRDSDAQPANAETAIIYNGVALPRVPLAGPANAAVFRVLFAGRFEDQKGIDVLCAAIPLVHLPPGTRGELVIVGHGARQNLVNALANQNLPGWTVSVRGAAADLGPLFAASDLVVMPSRFEGLGLVAIEATLAGLPVVTTHAPGLMEALPADYPWRAAPGDANALAQSISLACHETARWPEIVRAAQSFAEIRFSPAAMGASYRALYERAAGVASPHSAGVK